MVKNSVYFIVSDSTLGSRAIHDHIRSHGLNEHQEQITLIGEGNSDFTLWI